MKTGIVARIVASAVLAWSGTLSAHHSLARFDTTTPVWVKGTDVRFERINPHSRILLDQTGEQGRAEHWVIDGPSPNVLARMGLTEPFLKIGDVIEVCGFALRQDVASQPAPPTSGSPAMSGRLLNGHLLVMPDGKRKFWSDYGQFEKCLAPGETKETYRREAFGR